MFETDLFKLLLLEKKRQLDGPLHSGDTDKFDIWDEIRKRNEQFKK